MKKILCFLLLLCTGIFVCACSQPQVEPDNDPAQQSANEPEKDSQVLVEYFSATGTTKGVAEKIAQGLNADLFEIVPEQPYSDEDLDYGNDESRTTIEMNDPSSRPEIANTFEKHRSIRYHLSRLFDLVGTSPEDHGYFRRKL